MLIQITNRCHEGCAHCLQNSLPDGPHMDMDTFMNALRFAAFLKTNTIIISGGEPTEHPEFYQFCKTANQFFIKKNIIFSVISNGMWYEDPDKVKMVKRLSSLQRYAGMQVYTNKEWYKHYDYIKSHEDDFKKMPNIVFDETDLYMQDLGRAKFNPKAQAEVANNPYHMSCLNGHLLFKQLSVFNRMKGFFRDGMMCKPFVDFRGNVHLSESCQCQSFGNVNDDYALDIFKAMQAGKPCLKCALGRKYSASSAPDIIRAKGIIGI